MPFLPITLEEMKEYGWEQPDFVYVIGDAYIDHPSFGPAIISRTLENFGYKVCIISQPDINNNKDFKIFGKPRLGFLVCGGNIDSMVDHYSVSKKFRKKDYYTPGADDDQCSQHRRGNNHARTDIRITLKRVRSKSVRTSLL